ncbi:MAG TPA: hypothetical protein VG866_01345 [Candidatus Paceibacterota bacterium]|nr:hypothetical protein [Candidatus Paceibacterota bacterium]
MAHQKRSGLRSKKVAAAAVAVGAMLGFQGAKRWRRQKSPRPPAQPAASGTVSPDMLKDIGKTYGAPRRASYSKTNP